MKKDDKIVRRAARVFLVLCAAAAMVFACLVQTDEGDSGTESVVWQVVHYGLLNIWKNNVTLTTDIYHGVQKLIITSRYNSEVAQAGTESDETSPMMSAYLQNHVQDFEVYLEEAAEETLLSYLNLAVDQQRDDFIAAVLKKMPADWNADELAEEMIGKHSFHALCYLLDYTSTEKHPGWFAAAIDSGDADIVFELYQRLPDTDAVIQAETVYQNMCNAKTSMGKLRHITVFEVFCLDLPESAMESFYDRALSDGEEVFVSYFEKKRV